MSYESSGVAFRFSKERWTNRGQVNKTLLLKLTWTAVIQNLKSKFDRLLIFSSNPKSKIQNSKLKNGFLFTFVPKSCINRVDLAFTHVQFGGSAALYKRP
jgi:hypothetical protein